MPRTRRRESATGIYHVVVRGLDKKAVFNEKREKTRILNLIHENFNEYNVEIYAYCIMSNHFHLLLKAELKELASFMAKVLAGYAQYYNYKHHRTGYVFQGRYRSQCIESESYFWNCLRYIHMNPVKANMCNDIMKYQYSSSTEYYGLKSKDKAILHENAFVANNKRFQKRKEFVDFHRLGSRNIFIDIPKEELLQRKEAAEEVLVEMEYDLKIPAEEILDYARTRAEFESRIREMFGISKHKAEEIRKLLENEMGQGKVQLGTG